MFDLRIDSFRECFIDHLPYGFITDKREILSRLNNNVTDKDIIKLCLELAFYKKYDITINVERLFFNYKMEIINDERVANFRKICREVYGVEYEGRPSYYVVRDLFIDMLGDDKFTELIDIFLDEV